MKKLVNYELYPLAENAIVIKAGNEISENSFLFVQQIVQRLENKNMDGLIEIVPSFTTVTVYYDPLFFFAKGVASPYEKVCEVLKEVLDSEVSRSSVETRIIEIPVCYGGEFGPDMRDVCAITGMNEASVINLHAAGEYVVYAIGFAPGFPYLGGMNEKLACPRKASPRTMVPAGSVGIAGKQTGIYSLDTPGGWQIIGRTPVALFRPEERSPSLLQAGGSVRFVPITAKQFWSLKGGVS